MTDNNTTTPAVEDFWAQAKSLRKKCDDLRILISDTYSQIIDLLFRVPLEDKETFSRLKSLEKFYYILLQDTHYSL